MRGILKRKFEELDDHPCYYSSSSSSSSPSSSLSSPASSEWESDGESSPTDLNQDFTPHSPPPPTSVPVRSIVKRPRLTLHRSSVHFDLVTVFSFPRCQGFSSVPSHGGSSLGMARRHCALQRYTVAEHAAERQHRRALRRQERVREERLEAFKQKLISSGAIDQSQACRLTVDHLPEEDAGRGVGDAELREGGSLVPYSSRQRQAILLAAGVKRIDKEEKRQLHALRLSREDCGCDCQGFCEPETCACSLAGIKCQVDRFSFPCGCSKDGCGNTEGYVEFDARRVRTHYIHTVMRLELERTIQDKGRGVEVRPPEDLVEREEPRETTPVDDNNCPFGFSQEETGLPLTVPAVAPFTFSLERSAMEESSCSSNMTESSCSDSETASHSLPACGPSNDTFKRGPLTHRPDTPGQHGLTSDCTAPFPANTSVENHRTSGYVDENANPATGLFEDESLECLSSAPSPTLDYCRYIDPSLSSDSDLEFFDSDYPSGPLHSSFKAPRLPDSVHQLQLFSSVVLPHYESSTFLLESLISD
ncbi:cysteine/serine-rich nuclear protein 1-like [Neosynchiropus ocellatus]